MADDVEISLDPSGYLVGVNQLDQANQRLQRSFSGVTTTSVGVQRALDAVTPGRAAIAGMTIFAQQAASTEQSLSGLQATSAVTNVSVGKLSTGIRQMARDMPLGYTASKQMVEQITRMGVAGAGSESKITSLATSVSKLSGATGDGPTELAKGMVELSRATGNSNLDPARFTKLGDSLTTVSAMSGASATGILAFSKNIAPMAQAAGIGATGVLGISTAFAKLGEDGFGASTAVNKMLTDLNRSVREGSPEIKSYAAIVGKSADEFERLFKANPAEALTQITESIAKAGTGGPRLLEQLGIEGVRGQRSIQALVASGGLRESISTAVGAYGSGSTDKASAAAFGGLNDSLIELKETTSEVADALGRPLLGPLTAFTNLLQKVAGGAANVAGSGPVQGGLTALAYGGVGLMAGRALLGPLAAMGLVRQAATSGPLRSVFGGLTAGTGSTGFMSRYGAGATAAYGDGRMGPINTRIYETMRGYGTEWAAQNPPTGQSGFLSRARAGAGAWGGNLLNTYMRSVGQQYANAATTDPFNRRDSMRMSAGFQAATAAAQGVNTQGMNQWQQLRAGMTAFHKELVATTGTTVSARQQIGAFGSMAAQQGRLIGALGRDAGRGLAAGASRVGNFLGPGMLVGGALAAGTFLKQRMDDQSDANKQLINNDISGTLNAYRESIGKATDSTKTFAQLNEQFTSQLVKRSSAGTFDQARAVTADDIAAATSSPDKITRRYSGSAQEIAGQISSFSPMGLAPDELQAIKVDLLRQLTPDVTSQVLSALPGTTDVTKTPAGGSLTTKSIQQAVSGISASPRTNGLANFLGAGGGSEQFNDTIAGFPNFFGPGRVGYVNPLSDDAMKSIQGIAEGIAQVTSQQSDKFGSDYAQQEQAKSMNAALKAAWDKGDVAQFYELSKRFGVQLGGQDVADQIWSAQDFEKSGFDFTGQVASKSNTYRNTRNTMLAAGGAVMPGQTGIGPSLKQSIYYDTIAPTSPFLASAFDSRASSPMANAMRASIAAPADVKLQEEATAAVVQGAHAAGKSMADLAIEASKSANAVADNTDQYARLKAVQQRAEQQMAYEQQSMAPGAAQIQQYQYYSQKASITPQTDAQRTEVEQAKQQVVQIEDAMRQRMVARLQMQRQYEITVSRANEDFTRQQLYAEQDYETQRTRLVRGFNIQREQQAHQYNLGVSRAEEDFARNRARTVRDYTISVKRAEEDFAKTRGRTMRDFYINAARAEEDYQLSRQRQIRDFNKQLARSIQDAAATMYDPYTRIQTKATWDAKNLVVNMNEQTAALAKQKSQLDELRRAGLSAQAIDVLGLGKAENAQQVRNLSADASQDPAVIKQLNEAAAAKAAASGTLFTDASNKELARQREDLAKSLSDQALDFAKSVERSRADLKKGLTDSEVDFAKSLQRQRADLTKGLADSSFDFALSMARQGKDYAYSLSQSRRQLNITMSDMATDRDRAIKRAREGLTTSLKRMQQDIANSDLAIAGSMSQLADQVNRAIHGKAVNWQSILKKDTLSWVTDMQKNVIPKVGGVFAAFGVRTTTTGAGSSAAADRTYGGSSGAGSSAAADRGYHTGGSIEGRSKHEKADDFLVRATGGEFMHNVHAVRHYGTDAMHAINNRSVPKERLLQAVRGYADGGWINPVAPVKPGFPWGHYPSGGIHRALDYPVRTGTPVYSPWTGQIWEAGWSNTGFGNHIRMKNQTGIGTILGHLSKLFVKDGMKVVQRQLLGWSGSTGNSTGPHLHLEMRRSLYDPSTAFDFTKLAGGGAGIAGVVSAIASAATAAATAQTRQAALAGLFSGMRNIPGPYNQLTAEAKRRMTAKLYDQGGIMEPGGGSYFNGTSKPEKVLTDSQWASISQLAAMGGMGGISRSDLRGMSAAAGSHIVINNSGSVTYDQRNDFSGADITVVSQDPDEMARKLEDKQIAQRVTQTRGVRRSR